MRIYIIGIFILSLIMGFTQLENNNKLEINMKDKKSTSKGIKLGAFSTSLSVKDLKLSKTFYENMGFEVLGGGFDKNYLIMKNENALIGLFQGMFEGNILTFNPGWDENAKNTESFDDIRQIQESLKSKGVQLEAEVKDGTTGPGNIVLKDPDGNLIMIDQHR